jgi:hypothetical protein
MSRTNIASFFMSRLILHRFLMRALILHRFLMARTILHRFLCRAPILHRFFSARHKILIDVASFITRTPYFAILHDFCDRALCDRALPLPTRKLTGGGIPLLLRLGVLKKGSARLYAKKRLHPQYCIVF